jgi:hypothetical protein
MAEPDFVPFSSSFGVTSNPLQPLASELLLLILLLDTGVRSDRACLFNLTYACGLGVLTLSSWSVCSASDDSKMVDMMLGTKEQTRNGRKNSTRVNGSLAIDS